MAATVFSMRCLSVLLSLLLLACTAEPGVLIINRAELDGNSQRLVLDVSLKLSRTQLEALDQGVPLTFVFLAAPIASASARHTITLRYSPLTRQYELSDSNEPAPRLFDSRTQMLSTLDRISLPINGAPPRGLVRARLDLGALPPALRMTARFDPSWKLETATVEWRS